MVIKSSLFTVYIQCFPKLLQQTVAKGNHTADFYINTKFINYALQFMHCSGENHGHSHLHMNDGFTISVYVLFPRTVLIYLYLLESREG